MQAHCHKMMEIWELYVRLIAVPGEGVMNSDKPFLFLQLYILNGNRFICKNDYLSNPGELSYIDSSGNFENKYLAITKMVLLPKRIIFKK